VSEERFDKIRFYLKNGKYPNGADRAEKSRLRSAATHYKLTPGNDDEPEKLWLKGKEVISDAQRQYEIARDVHHKSHGGINKTTAAIAELYHWVRIKETVSQVIRNCPECSEMNKGLSAMRAAQTQSRSSQPASTPLPQLQQLPPQPQHQQQQQQPQEQILSPPAPPHTHPQTHQQPQPQFSLPSSGPPTNPHLHLTATHPHQHAHTHPTFPYDPSYDMPVDPALTHSLRPAPSLADLPPSPFLAPTQPGNMNDVRMSGLDGDASDDAQGLGGGGNGDGGGGGGVGGVSLGTRKEGRQSDRVVKTTGRVGRERVTRYGGVR
jgi:hypothetical protein